MRTSPENEIKKIYKKSIRLLNDKQARLIDMQQVLKKAVIRLSLATRSDNKQVNSVLTEMKVSVADTIDIGTLNKQLDQLFLLINHADFRVEKTALFNYLKGYLEDQKASSLSDEVFSKVRDLVAKELPDDEISAELLKSLNDLSCSNQQYSDSINLFIKNITESTSFTFDRRDINTSEIMQDLAIELAKYIYTEQKSIQTRDSTDEKGINDADENNNVRHVLNEIVNQLSLPESSKQDKFAIVKSLNSSDVKIWKNIIAKLVQLINKSISTIDLEKHELEAYLSKISTQLTDIESFMHTVCQDTDAATTRAMALTESVETGVSSIEQTVTKSTDLPALKHDVALNLKDIRKHVVEYKRAEKVKHDISLQSYSTVIAELSSSRKESEALQAQLHESKTQLLRDPLTGIANRLAYDERVSMEFNRWKRSNVPLCLAIWDIDHFKQINDKYGHAVGDRVLRLFAEIINTKIRKTDMFARIGGEEFVLIMPDTTLQKAVFLNDKLRQSFEKCNFHYDGHNCQITSSVGIADFRRGDDVDMVLDKADQALYQSKNEGRNRCTTFSDI